MGNIALRNISLGNIVLTHKQSSTHSPDFSPDVELLDKHYRPVAPHYGNVKLVRDKNTSETMLLKEVFANTKEAFEQELRFFNNRIALKHPNVVDILGFTSEETKNFCSNYFKVSVFFEVIEKDLQTDLEQRIKEKKFYSENELFLIADNLISALSYFQNQGHAHGDIRPFNIFVKGSTHKLSDPSLNPQKLSNGLTLAIVEGAKALLAPELLEQVPQNQFEIKTDIHKADVFSLGATLLGLATLTHAEDMYDYKAGKLNIYVLEERLEILKFCYSVVAYDLIKSMLTINVNERPDFFVFTNRLLPYQEEIRSLRPLPFTSSKFTPSESIHTDTQVHQYDTGTHHHYEEIIKKTGPTVKEIHTYTHDYVLAPESETIVHSNDVLDNQIKAAIDRTEETLKIFRPKESTPSTITGPYEALAPYTTAGEYVSDYAAAPLAYSTQSPYTRDLTTNYLAEEKENIFKASPDYGVSSTQPSYRPTTTYDPSGLQTSPYPTSMYPAGVSQPEGLLGSLLVQELSHDIEKLTQKLEEEGIMSVQDIMVSPEVVTRKVVIEPVSASKEPNVAVDEQARVMQEEKLAEGRISVEENQLQSQMDQIRLSTREEGQESVQPEGQGQIQEENFEKEKEPEVQSGAVDTLSNKNAKETKEIQQESYGRQEGEIEVIDHGGEQERPPGISEIQI